MIHPLADVKSNQIGRNCSIWQFAVILENAVIGDECNINCHTFIENDVVLGNNVTVKSGIYLWDGIHIEDNVFLGPNVVFTNDIYPRSKRRVEFKSTLIKKGASIGANSTILGGVTIGKFAMTGIASVVKRDVPNHALVYGNPARIRGWIGEDGEKLNLNSTGQYVSANGDVYVMAEDGLSKHK